MSEPEDPRLDAALRALAGPDEDDLDEAALAQARALVRGDTGVVAWLSSRPSWQRAGLVLLFMALVVVGVALGNGRPDLAAYPAGRLLLEAGGTALLAASLGLLALRGAHRSDPTRSLVFVLLGTAVLFPVALALLPPADLMLPGAKANEGREAASAIACFGYGVAVAVPLGLVLRALHRGPPPGPARLLLSLLGAALVGVLALQLHCPIAGTTHLMLGHASLPLLALLLVSILTRARS